MKKILYGIGLISLPIVYVGLMLGTDQPIEWSVLVLMALICVPLLFWIVIGKVEKDFNALSDKEKIAKVASAAKTIARKGVGAGD